MSALLQRVLKPFRKSSAKDTSQRRNSTKSVKVGAEPKLDGNGAVGRDKSLSSPSSRKTEGPNSAYDISNEESATSASIITESPAQSKLESARSSKEESEGAEWRRLERRGPNLRRLGLDECLLLVLACSDELQKRGGSVAGVMRPFRQNSEPALMVHLIDLFSIDRSSTALGIERVRSSGSRHSRTLSEHRRAMINPAFLGALSHAKPQTVAALLRWAIRHLKVPRRGVSSTTNGGQPASPRREQSGNGGTGMRWFKSFVAAEAANKYPKTAYSDIFLPSIPAANGELITCLLHLATILSADDVNVGVRCVRSWAFWVFGAQARDFVPTGTLRELGWGDRPTKDTFWDGVGVNAITAEYNKVANAMERLWIAYIRDLSAQERSNVPRALAEKTMTVYPLNDRTLARRINVLLVRTRSEIEDVYGQEDDSNSQTSETEIRQRRSPAQTVDNALRASSMPVWDPGMEAQHHLARLYMKELISQRRTLRQDDILPNLDYGLFTKESARVTQILAYRDNTRLPALESVIPFDRDTRQEAASPTYDTSPYTQRRMSPISSDDLSSRYEDLLNSSARTRSQTPSGAPIAEIFRRISTKDLLAEDERLGARPGTAVRALSPTPLSDLERYRSESRFSMLGSNNHYGNGHVRSMSRQSFIPLIKPHTASLYSQATSPPQVEEMPLDVDKFLSDGFGSVGVEKEVLKLNPEAESLEFGQSLGAVQPSSKHHQASIYTDDDQSSRLTIGGRDPPQAERPILQPKQSRRNLATVSPAPCVILSAEIAVFDVAFIDFWLDSLQDEVCPWGNVGMLQLKKQIVDQVVQDVGGSGVDWLLVEEICVPKGISPTPSVRSAAGQDLYATSPRDGLDLGDQGQSSFLGGLSKKASSLFERTKSNEAPATPTPKEGSNVDYAPTTNASSNMASEKPVVPDRSIGQLEPPAATIRSQKSAAAVPTTTTRSVSVLGLGSTLASWWLGNNESTVPVKESETKTMPSTRNTEAVPQTPTRSVGYAPDPPTPGPLQTPDIKSSNATLPPGQRAEYPTRLTSVADDRSVTEGTPSDPFLGRPVSVSRTARSPESILPQSPTKTPSSRPMSPFNWRRGNGSATRPSDRGVGNLAAKKESSPLTHLPSLSVHKVSTLNTPSKRAPVDVDSDDDEEFPMRSPSRMSNLTIGASESKAASSILNGPGPLSKSATASSMTLKSNATSRAAPTSSRSSNGLTPLSEDGPMLPPRSTSRLAIIGHNLPFRSRKGHKKKPSTLSLPSGAPGKEATKNGVATKEPAKPSLSSSSSAASRSESNYDSEDST